MGEIFNQLLTSRPVDRAAARVIGCGVEYEPDKKIVRLHWSAPPATIAVAPFKALNPLFDDLTGLVVGRMKVIGYLGKIKKNKPALWLVRCNCGDYEARKSKA